MKTNNTTKLKNDVFTRTEVPSKKLLKLLQEIEAYKKGTIKLKNFKNTKDLFKYLDK